MRPSLDLDLDVAVDRLAARIVSLEDDVAAYRLLAQEAVHALHAATEDRTRLREQYRRALEELRLLRAEMQTGLQPEVRRAA